MVIRYCSNLDTKFLYFNVVQFVVRIAYWNMQTYKLALFCIRE